MRTNGEIEHDAQVRSYLRRIADVLDAIAGTLAAIGDMLKPLDDIEAAWTRERDEIEAQALSIGGIVEASRHKPGNAAAMREALKPWIAFAEWMLENAGKDKLGEAIRENGPIIRQRLEELRAALSAPPRQCDVGTPDELGMRYKAFCRKHFTPDELGGNCRKCPLKDRSGWSCQLAWAQTPYEAEEGGAA